MTRLIDADRLMSDFLCTFYNDLDDQNRTEKLINEAPTVEERPHGEWIPYTTIDGYTKHATCTNCGYERKVGMGCSLDENNLPKYCEACGADMRKEGESE